MHKELEARSRFLGTEDTILYRSCFDANGGLFETLLGEEDAVISDALNHASIIDGIRLCKAQRSPLRAQRHGRARAPCWGSDATLSTRLHRHRR
jgi:7-keto-8-aminopelargonate synthetase-like enzyme